MRILISEIELHGEENESKKNTVEKIFLNVNLKVNKMVRLYVLGKQMRPIIVKYMSYNEKKQEEKPLKIEIVSPQKHKLFNKNN